MAGPFVVLLLLALACLSLFKRKHPDRFPPHPWLSPPIIGDLYYFKNGFTSGLEKLRRRHGDIFGFLFGRQRFVVLCNFSLIKEASMKNELNGRFTPHSVAKLRGTKHPDDSDTLPGLSLSTGKTWKEQRRISTSILKNLETGDHFVQEQIIKDVDCLCQDIKKHKGQAIDIKTKLRILAAKSVWAMSVGEELDMDNPEVMNIMSLMNDFFLKRGSVITRLMAFHPILNRIAMKIQLSMNWCNFPQSFLNFLDKKILFFLRNNLKQSGNEIDGLMSNYLSTMSDPGALTKYPTLNGKLGYDNLKNLIMEFFAAGSENISSTISWAMLFMVLHPDIQNKVHQELDSKIGRGNKPDLSDRPLTPYTDAVLHEVQRLGKVTDKGLLHRCIIDCRLSSGHQIPKGTMIVFWLGEAMKDPSIFPRPEVFDPTRFLGDSGSFKPHHKVIPFGVGKRQCIGQSLSLAQIYLVFTGILSTYKLEKAHPNDHINACPLDGATLSPMPFKIKYITRL